MKSIFDPEAKTEVLRRIDSLTHTARAEWGKMDVAQMLAHCVKTTEMAAGKIHPKRAAIGYFLGPLFKRLVTNEKPFRRNSPTHPNFIMADPKEFTKERNRLKEEIAQLTAGGLKQVTTHPHPFFGNLQPEEWGTLAYKHLDHHLRQFGK